MTIALSRPHLLQTGRRGRASVARNSRSALTSNPHSARCTTSAQLPATSCLGASRTPAASARGGSRHAGVRETYTQAEVILDAPLPRRRRNIAIARGAPRGRSFGEFRLMSITPVASARAGNASKTASTNREESMRHFLAITSALTLAVLVSGQAVAQQLPAQPIARTVVAATKLPTVTDRSLSAALDARRVVESCRCPLW